MKGSEERQTKIKPEKIISVTNGVAKRNENFKIKIDNDSDLSQVIWGRKKESVKEMFIHCSANCT